ncbi:JmjC domain-containing protein [Pontibacillus halophilus]|uniref:JmjC domain-containing protein n=1 Tax=Pontibacillus halophilus TaxID=516704 RepID=UPI00040A879B|nr:cupin domain-containing protein [Pontibacillus halophilus]
MGSLDYILNTLEQINKEGYWSNKPFLRRKKEEDLDWTEDVFSTEALKWLLVEARIPEECFRVIKNGIPQPHLHYSRPIYVGQKTIGNVLDGNKASEALKDGGSLLLTALEEYWPPLGELCSKIGNKIGTKCAAFGVITPPNQGGFVPHIDRTEQVVIQCEGTKLWDVYDIYKRGNKGQEVNIENLPEPLMHKDISTGDILYLPQGAPHAAKTTESISIHITLTFEPVTMEDWIISGLKSTINNDEEYKMSLPPFYFNQETTYLKLLNEKLYDIKAELNTQVQQRAIKHMSKYRSLNS